jgi:hypothetical protein
MQSKGERVGYFSKPPLAYAGMIRLSGRYAEAVAEIGLNI